MERKQITLRVDEDLSFHINHLLSKVIIAWTKKRNWEIEKRDEEKKMNEVNIDRVYQAMVDIISDRYEVNIEIKEITKLDEKEAKEDEISETHMA